MAKKWAKKGGKKAADKPVEGLAKTAAAALPKSGRLSDNYTHPGSKRDG